MLVRRWGGGGGRGGGIERGWGLVRGRDIGRSWFGGGRVLWGMIVFFFSFFFSFLLVFFSALWGRGLC